MVFTKLTAQEKNIHESIPNMGWQVYYLAMAELAETETLIFVRALFPSTSALHHR